MTRTSLTAFCLVASLAASALADVSNGVPRIVCAEPAYEFGSLDNNQTIARAFVISNAGSAELVIGNVRACCGSTAKLDRDHLPPGSNATLAVTLALTGRTGPVHKSIYLASNDPVQPYCRISLSGTATVAPALERTSVDFGDVAEDFSGNRTATVPMAATAPFNVTNVAVEGRGLTATCVKTKSGHLVTAMLTPPLPRGALHGKVTLFTDRAAHGRMTIPVSANVLDDLVLVPETLRLAIVPGSTNPVSRCLAVRSRTGRTIAVRDVSFPRPGANISTRQDGTNGCLIEITGIQPLPLLDGKNVVISFSQPAGREVKFPIRVYTEKR